MRLCCVLLLVIGMWYVGTFIYFLNAPLLKSKAGEQSDSLIIDIQPDLTFKQLANNLYQQGYLKHPLYFVLYARFRDDAKRIQAGEYALPYTVRPDLILNQLVQGNVRQHKLTIIEGQTVSDLLASMQADLNLIHTLEPASSSHACHKFKKIVTMDPPMVAQSFNPAHIACQLGVIEENLEGLLYPDTYAFPKGTSDVAFLNRAYARMQTVLADAWTNRGANLPYQSPYAALVLASLVEKETAISAEKPIIAGIMVNRLKKGMPLQIDAAVLYGLNQATGQNKRKLSRADLRFDTPYNTYLHRGIPPTPIAFTSLSSIEAVLHPAATQNLYYVAKGDGSHYFSKTYQAHRRAVVEYQLNPQPITGAK